MEIKKTKTMKNQPFIIPKSKIVKRYLLFIFILLLFDIGIGYLSYFELYDSHRELVENNERSVVNTLYNSIDLNLGAVKGDLRYLANYFEFQYNDSSKSMDQSIYQIEQNFKFFAAKKLIYDQIRYIDSSGLEIIRINYADNRVNVVKKNLLQNKADRYYFKEAICCQVDELYTSPIDLNIENDSIEKPLKPMIRFAVPIFSQTRTKIGVIILNYKAQYFLDIFKKKRLNSYGTIDLVNENGYYLVGDSTSWEWGFMIPDRKHHNFSNNEEKKWNYMYGKEKGFKDINQTLVAFRTFHLKLNEGLNSPMDNSKRGVNNSILNKWKIISIVTEDDFKKLMDPNIADLKLVLFVFSIVLSITLWFLAKNITYRKAYVTHIDDLNLSLTEKVRERTIELNILNTRLEKSLDKEKELGEVKSQIINTISHEYRTPLTVIMNSVEILKILFERKETDNVENLIVQIKQSVNIMMELMNSIASYHRHSVEKVELNIVPLTSKVFIQDIMTYYSNPEKKRNLVLIADTEDIAFESDYTLIAFVIREFIDNAFKFSDPDEKVKIDVRTSLDRINFHVIDQGSGIPEGDLERIFSPFFKCASTVGIKDGVGIGLSIAKLYANNICGEINVKTELNQGSTFTLSIPLKKDSWEAN